MGTQTTPAQLFYDSCLDDHVPGDHLLRRIDRFLDLEKVRTELKPFYSSIGRPSIDPELMKTTPNKIDHSPENGGPPKKRRHNQQCRRKAAVHALGCNHEDNGSNRTRARSLTMSAPDSRTDMLRGRAHFRFDPKRALTFSSHIAELRY
jgi:hypothetical protein